ncbi:MAG: hypothetical protein RLZZ175_1966 [Bacteroidota bacterium]|jgi:hypothetical protein
MKNVLSYIAMLLCAISINISSSLAKNSTSSISNGIECSCCNDCKSDKCKEHCTKYDKLSDKEKKSEVGTKLKEECAQICKKEKCCTDDSCNKKNTKKGCCK